MNNQEYHHCIPRSKVVEVFKLKVGIICAGIQRGQGAPRVAIALKKWVEKYSSNHLAESHLVGVVPQVVIRVCVWVVIHTLLVACEESLKEYRRILSCWNFFYNIHLNIWSFRRWQHFLWMVTKVSVAHWSHHPAHREDDVKVDQNDLKGGHF